MQIVAFALEKRMFLDVQHNIKIPGWPTVCSGFAQPGKTYPRSIFDARRHLRVHRSLTQHASLALALQARIRDHAARPLTGGTSARHAEESLLISNLPTPS